MKKLIKLEFNNTTQERKTEDSFSELYSYDKNNGSFEFEILNDTLTTEQVTALFKFTESNKIWKTTGTVEGNKVKVTFDTTLITQNETVICYLYFDEEQRTSDTFRFKFKVKVSEIDKMNRYEVKERFINNTVIVDRLDVVTKDELREALKNVGGIATEGLLTEVKAEELFVKKTDAVDNTNFELVKNRVLALELKTDKDTLYDDSELKGRISVLEAKEDNNTIYDDTNVRERLTALESKPNVDVNNLVTKEELESKGYLTTHQDLTEYAKKSELYNDSDLKARVEVLEQKTDKDTVYDDTPLKERVTALESKAVEGGAYDDSDLRNRVVALETKEDKDTKYDDTEVKHRLTELENKPAVDTSFFVTEEKLNSKGYISDISGLATKQELANAVTKDELEAKHYVTEEELNNKAYLTQQNLDNYALKYELPTPYNDSLLNERVTALESKAIEGGAYNDTDLRNRVINLENKPPLDTSEFVTNQALESKGYIKDVSNLVTKEELASKNYLTEHQPLTEVNNRLDVLEAKQDKDTVYNDSELRNRVTELESRPIVTPYNDTPLKERVEVLENKVDKDTVYNDSELRERVTNLENKPNVDLTNYVTTEQLESKHYLTQHQPLDNLVTKEELNSKGYLTEHQNIAHLVTKEELESKGYLTQHQSLEEYAKKSELYNDTEVKQRLTTLENKPNIDTSNFITNEQLKGKHYLTEHQPLTHLATTSDLEALRNVSVSKSELSKKVDTTEYNTLKDIVVTKDELAGKGYLTEHQDISNLATKQEVEDTYAKKTDLPTPYNDSALVSRVTALESKPTTNQTLSISNNTLSISNGNSVELPSSQSEMRGTGMPNGVVEAPIGTTYIDTAKTNGALKWIKTTDGGNTGWKVAEGDTGWVLGWQEDTGNNTNRMYFRRKNDVVHVKFNPEIKTSDISGETNLILNLGGYELVSDLSIQGFKPVDDIVQTIYRTSRDIYSSTASTENSEGAQGTGAVIIQYEYYRRDKTGLKLQIVTSDLGVKENHVNPFSYLTEDEWPVQLP